MLPVAVKNNAVPAKYGPTGLNGWFGRLMKKLVNAAINIIDSVPIIGPAIAHEIRNMVADWTNNFGENDPDSWWNRGTTDYEPNAAEEAILTKWHTEKFQPFYKKMAEALSAALQQQDFAAQVAGINAALNKMCVVRSYFLYNETAGLSANAIAWRASLIDELFIPIEGIIEDAVSDANLASLQVSVAITDFSPYAPLITSGNTSYTCYNYLGGNAAQNQSFLPSGTTATQPIKDANALPVVPVIKVPASGNEETKTSGNSIIAIGLGILGAILLLGGGKKKKREN